MPPLQCLPRRGVLSALLLLAALLPTLSGCGNSDSTTVPVTGTDVPEMVALDSAMTRFVTEWNIPGASLAVAKDDRLVYARGFGYARVETGEPVQPYSLFRVASVSKSITSAAIMKLLEEGKLMLDQNIFGLAGILNDTIYADISDPRVYLITVRDLLQHTGGWDSSDYDPQYDALNIARAMGIVPPANSTTIIRYMLVNYILNFDPGTKFHYSNFGYNILGRIIEKLSGLGYESYVQKNILDPAGAVLMRIGDDLERDRGANEVTYYDMPGRPLMDSVYGTGEKVRESYGGFNLRAEDSEGGWIASASDLLRFLTVVDGLPERPDILKPETVQTMTTVSPALAGKSSYALGWFINTNGNWYHNGASETGTYAVMMRRLDGIAWAVIFNRLPIDSNNSFNAFETALSKCVNEALAAVQTWPPHDLFLQ